MSHLLICVSDESSQAGEKVLKNIKPGRATTAVHSKELKPNLLINLFFKVELKS